ncbi:bifunctional oligoribonuclease/PAP phosphatase NrnA [Pseudonocardiaceae bacterium YIM PH 21723]|nr:bifunctional oligoribonuclease/PAP phosphatase NrnA [Pseudonocardiaceae bacterium YIM PH 21723]
MASPSWGALSGGRLDPQALLAATMLLRDATDVTLLAHINPDADALGSALALGQVLRRRGATVRVSFGWPRVAPSALAALDTDGLLVTADEVPATPATLVVMDTGSVERLGPLGDRVAATIEAGGQVLVIDHHATNTYFGTHNLVDATAEATAVLALRLIDELGEVLTEPVARCLYAGLLTDTGAFRRATPSTHLIAARLVEAGVDTQAVSRELMDSHPFGWLGMLAKVLDGAVLEPAGARGLGWVWTTVSREQARGLGIEEIDSVIDLVRTTREAEVAAVLKEIEPGEWAVSLRAVARVDVGSVALGLGGGGHRLAAGFTAVGEPEDIIPRLRAALDAAPLLR